jgi:hypothetical protein
MNYLYFLSVLRKSWLLREGLGSDEIYPKYPPNPEYFFFWSSLISNISVIIHKIKLFYFNAVVLLQDVDSIKFCKVQAVLGVPSDYRFGRFYPGP